MYLKSISYNVLTIIIAVVLSGCASIVSDSSYPIAIGSTPDTAKFVVTNRNGVTVHTGTTPSTVILKAGAGYFKPEQYTITVSKEGFSDKVYTLTSTLDGWYWGNILFGGLIGMLIVDPNTGAMYKLPASVNVSLDQLTSATNNQTLSIASYDSLTDEQKRLLIKVN